MNRVHKLRFWCQKVLPLVYDDSLSYYELLCKVVRYLNSVIDNINDIPEYIDEAIDEKLSDEHLKELIGEVFKDLKEVIAEADETGKTNASTDYDKGRYIWFDNVLYITTKAIPQGNSFIFDGTNMNVRKLVLENQLDTVYDASESKLTIHAKIV